MTWSSQHPHHSKLTTSSLLWLLISLTSCGPSPTDQFHQLDKAGKRLYHASNYPQAIQKWQQAIKIPIPKPPSLYLSMAEAWLSLAEPDKANDIIKQARTIYPANTDLIIEAARIQLMNSQTSQAEKTLQRLKELQLPAVRPQSHAEEYILRGDILSIKGKLAAAESAYQRAIAIKSSPKALIRLALCRLGSHDINGATEAYKKLTSTMPKDPKILNQIGIFWRLKRNYKKAEYYILEAIRLDPGNVLFKKTLAEFYFGRNQQEKAGKTVSEALEIAPDSPQLNNFLIEILLGQNKITKAAAILKDLDKDGSKDIIFHLLQGKYFLLNKQPYLAISHFSEAIKYEPKLPISHYLLALAYLANQRPGLAEQSAIEALTLNHYFSAAELLLADIYYGNEQYSLALKHVNRILTREPENFRPQLLKGCILLAKEQYPKANDHFNKAAILNPSLKTSQYFSARTLEFEGKIKRAARVYRQILQTNPNMLPAAQRYIALLQKGEQQGKEINAFINSLPTDAKNSPEFQNMLGMAYSKTQKVERAINYFKKAVQLDAHQTEAYMGMAKIFEMGHRWPELIEVLENCIKNQPSYIPAILELAEFYNRNNQAIKAKTLIENGLNQAPDSPQLANSLAWLLLEDNKDIDRAFILAQKSYERMPHDPAISDTLGWAYYKKKMFTRAEWLLEEALEESPQQPIIHIHLGQVLLAKGKKDQALQHITSGLDLSPPPQYKEIAQRLISTINQNNKP